VARYEVIESVKNLVPEDHPLSSLDLTVWDFFPAELLEERGLTDPSNLRASVLLSSKVLGECLEDAWNSFKFEDEIKELEILLED
jgi:hypothetical protein